MPANVLTHQDRRAWLGSSRACRGHHQRHPARSPRPCTAAWKRRTQPRRRLLRARPGRRTCPHLAPQKLKNTRCSDHDTQAEHFRRGLACARECSMETSSPFRHERAARCRQRFLPRRLRHARRWDGSPPSISASSSLPGTHCPQTCPLCWTRIPDRGPRLRGLTTDPGHFTGRKKKSDNPGNRAVCRVSHVHMHRLF